jgi:glycosyltransferase involved in cell wall biosynthesis
MLENTLISVCMITYKHEGYIKSAIEGVLLQNYNGSIELIIADDNSPDNTEKIVKEIQNKHPKGHFIQYTKHKKNKGIIPNFVWALEQCKGKYIALCDGDDYWTDPLKLQKQIDFLESNKCYTGVSSNVKVVYENSDKGSHLFKNNIKQDTFKLNDLLQGRFFHTATFVFRSSCFKKDFPDFILSGDRALFMLVACFGDIKYIKDVTAVYRKNEGGISRNVTSKQMMKDFNIANFIKKYNSNLDYHKLQAFIAYTVLSYSMIIYKDDFKKAKKTLYYHSLFEKGKFRPIKKRRTLITNFKIIKQNITKVKID